VAERSKKHYRSRKQAGGCVRCREEAVPGKVLCSSCSTQRLAEKVPKGLCRDCRTPVTDASRCAKCKDKAHKSYRRRIAEGVCAKCRNAAVAGAFCLEHWFANIGLAHGLTKKNGGVRLLQELWAEQKGLCAVTGVRLVPGTNASVDHLVPKVRGGGSSKGNLRWVTLHVNRMKWDMSDIEFVAMCVTIVRAAGHVVVDTRTEAASVDTRSN
jgi:hypothetical protein